MPVISEEASASAAVGAAADDFVLVDPLDGTRELVAGRDEFTVNLALVRGGLPVLGIVAAPALGTGLAHRSRRRRRAASAGARRAGERGAQRSPRSGPARCPKAGIVAAVSRSHLDPATDAFLARLGARFGEVRGSSGSAIKFCRVAEGAADIYPRLAPTHQWDVAAGHAVVAAAGGTVTTPGAAPLLLSPGRRLADPGFIAWGDPSAVQAAG